MCDQAESGKFYMVDWRPPNTSYILRVIKFYLLTCLLSYLLKTFNLEFDAVLFVQANGMIMESQKPIMKTQNELKYECNKKCIETQNPLRKRKHTKFLKTQYIYSKSQKSIFKFHNSLVKLEIDSHMTHRGPTYNVGACSLTIVFPEHRSWRIL